MKLFDKISSGVAKAGLEISKQKPEILIGVGITVGIIGCVKACKATLKADDILKETNEKLNQIAEVSATVEEYSEEDEKRDIRIVKTKAVVRIAKEYVLPVGLGVFAIGCIYTSHTEMKARGAAVVAAYNVLNEGFKYYRKNVVEEFGEEVDRRMFHGIKNKEVEVTEIDDNGEEVTTVKKANVIEDGGNPYAFIFSRETSNAWQPDQPHNMDFVESAEQWANILLQQRALKYGDKAVVLANEVLQNLQMDWDSNMAVAGWVYGKTKRIDLRATDIYKEAVHNGADIRALEPAVAMNFNCDGIVTDYLPDNKKHLKKLKEYAKNA